MISIFVIPGALNNESPLYMSDDLNPVFSPLFFRENSYMLMVTDLFPQNQQRSDIIGV